MAVRTSKYSGMKKNPYAHAPKNAIRDKAQGKKRKKKAGNGSVTNRKGLSKYQLRTQEEFMKVRENESKDEWLFRTRFRRIRTEDEIARTAKGRETLHKIDLKRYRASKKKLQLKVQEKNFNFLKYYVFIINWGVIKYGIPQTDLEVGFHFYENIHFTKDMFTNKCLLMGINSKNIFNRFKKEGYIVEMRSIVAGTTQKEPTGLYKLSRAFSNVLDAIYEKIAYQSHFDFRPTFEKRIPPELEKIIMEMSAENQDILTGKKEPDSLIIHKEIKNEKLS